MTPEESQVLRYASFGNPLEVLELKRLRLPTPSTGEIVVKLLFSSINPSDIGMIEGRYGRLSDLPAVPGREGIGEVIAVGDEVDGLEVGDRVRLPELRGIWRDYACIPAQDLLKLPADLPPDILAGAFVNLPTAVRVLSDFHKLEAGDWVIQNAANSAVGEAVVALAKDRGIRTINIVRRDSLIEPIKAMGGDLVINEEAEPDYPKTLRERIDYGIIQLALNSVGGSSVERLTKAISDGGTIVTFGGMVGEKIRFPTRKLIFHDIRLVGFWMDRWMRKATPFERHELHGTVFELIRRGVFKGHIEATYPLEAFREALEHNARPRMGKVLFRGPA
ncbi:MAG: MDR family NADPH-dependent oxidoreductase [Puniceicoccaceae bacterium]